MSWVNEHEYLKLGGSMGKYGVKRGCVGENLKKSRDGKRNRRNGGIKSLLFFK